MRVLVLYSHPVETSFNAAIHHRALAGLKAAGHEIDNCDLYAEGFNPVLTRAERLGYHDAPDNRAAVAPYVDRLLAAQGLVIVSPVWNYGFPAILKGFFDRVFLPGVSFRMTGESYVPSLHNITRLTAIMTYGGGPLRSWLAGDPPRRIVNRSLRGLIKPGSRVRHLAFYGLNQDQPNRRRQFLDRVESTLARF